MITVPRDDPVHALVPHTLTDPLMGAETGPLAGLAFMVKDLFAVEGRKVGAGNPDFYDHAALALETAPVIEKLRANGASLTGITICDEFFYSVLGTNAHYGQPVNPRARRYVTGGSSCGSAAATASAMCDFALGSDTGGSVRVPASFSGLYGLRPTHGRIDTTGMTPMAPSLDTAGLLARDPVLFAKAGTVLLDDARVEAPVERLILAKDILAHCDPRIADIFARALDRAEEAIPNPEPREIAGGEIEDWRKAFVVLQGFEIQSTLLPFVQSHNAALGPGIKERFEMAATITSGAARAARNLRRTIAERLAAIVPPGTAIVLPTTPTVAPESGLPDGSPAADRFRSLTQRNTCLAGLAGLPQISVPMGQAGGCPTGLSFIGWVGGDEALLGLAVRLPTVLT